MKKKERLKILLVILIAVFMMFGAAALLLGSFRRSQQKYQEKKEALSALDQVPTVVPTEGVSVTPSPSPTPRPTATPTPIPVKAETFNPDDFWDYWYSTDGLVTVNVYDISQESISFSFYQTDRNQTDAVSADIKAKVAGNAANFSFTDSAGNYATGNLIFDSGELYMNISTGEPVYSIYPNIKCIMSRTQVQPVPDPTATPVPEETEKTQVNTETGEYFFPESSSRYLTDEEISAYSSAQLELAKNEIYARHGRRFVTEYIADYFNSKSWYQGTIDPETFDSQQDSIFNEYEIANINKIAQIEEQKAAKGK